MIQYIRAIRFIKVALCYRLDQLIMPRWLAPSFWCMPIIFSNRIKQCCAQGRGHQLAAALEAMGPIFVKFAQLLSMRQDILPQDIVQALSRLQDQVAPYHSGVAMEQVERSLGQPISDVFQQFDEQPLASASIAQVHYGRLHTGESVAVKILRPGIRAAVIADIQLMYLGARIVSKCLDRSEDLKLVEVVGEIESSLHDELNLSCEAANASCFKRLFPDEYPLKVPKIYWHYSGSEVLVMECIQGVRVTDLSTLHAQGVNMKKLAELGLDLFFKQVFEAGFFHADMHGGNVFVNAQDPENPGYICVDFGIMGALSDEDKRYVAENLLAFFNRDYRRVAQLHLESGWVAPGTRIDQFESAIRAVSEPIFSLPLEEISFGRLLIALFKTVRRFEFRIQPQLILLQKTLMNVESLGGMLYPQLNLWETAQPYLERWVSSQMGVRASVSKITSQAPLWLEQIPDWPNMIHHILRYARQHTLQSSPSHSIESLKPQRNFKQLIKVMIYLMIGGILGQGLFQMGWILKVPV
ncbi:MAG: 2-polyprenylphenol 6-hydroxylase [Legionellales bacterium]|nr:2-polyprenylphenol 6-hydroxylase [Legionellales bacterium]